MKESLWKRINLAVIVTMIAVMVACVWLFTQTGCKQATLEDERRELLQENTWLELSGCIEIDGCDAFISYGVFDYSYFFGLSRHTEEYVYFSPMESHWNYIIYGKGRWVNEVSWSENRISAITISIPKMKSYANLPKEVIEEIAFMGFHYYKVVREHFKVDTYEGLKEVIKRERENIRRTIR